MSLDFSSDVNADFAMPILRRTSCTHLPSDVNMLPRYMKLFTCFKLVPCIVMLHAGMTVDFENTMVKDLDPFRYYPLFSLSRTTMSISCCNSSSISAIMTVSSNYWSQCHQLWNIPFLQCSSWSFQCTMQTDAARRHNPVECLAWCSLIYIK